MADYKIIIKPSAAKELEALQNQYLKKIVSIIESLKMNPRPHGCQKLSGKQRYRLRAGPYRILYSIEDKILVVWIVKIAHRKEIYR